MGRHIPGQPNVVVVNMPGGGSVTMTNQRDEIMASGDAEMRLPQPD